MLSDLVDSKVTNDEDLGIKYFAKIFGFSVIIFMFSRWLWVLPDADMLVELSKSEFVGAGVARVISISFVGALVVFIFFKTTKLIALLLFVQQGTLSHAYPNLVAESSAFTMYWFFFLTLFMPTNFCIGKRALELLDSIQSISLRTFKISISSIYFFAAIGKLSFSDWYRGIGFNDILLSNTDYIFGTIDYQLPEFLNAIVTYSTIVFELLLAIGIWHKRYSLTFISLGLINHVLWGVLFAIPSFSVAMIASYSLFFPWEKVKDQGWGSLRENLRFHYYVIVVVIIFSISALFYVFNRGDDSALVKLSQVKNSRKSDLDGLFQLESVQCGELGENRSVFESLSLSMEGDSYKFIEKKSSGCNVEQTGPISLSKEGYLEFSYEKSSCNLDCTKLECRDSMVVLPKFSFQTFYEIKEHGFRFSRLSFPIPRQCSNRNFEIWTFRKVKD